MKLEFQPVRELDFLTYLEDIKQKLAALAPCWKINRVLVPENPFIAIYHLHQWDFVTPNGKMQPKGYVLQQFPFAYDQKEEDNPTVSTYFLLNRSPIQPIAPK